VKKTVDTIISKLIHRNILSASGDNKLAITVTGKQVYQQCLEKQIDLRKRVTIGISEQDYQTAIATLQQMIRNLSK
jgi:hypothetical protein